MKISNFESRKKLFFACLKLIKWGKKILLDDFLYFSDKFRVIDEVIKSARDKN